MNRTLSLAFAAAILGGGVWFWTQSAAADDDFSQVFALCKTIPEPADADTQMAALGWAPLGADRMPQLLDATGLFHVATRRTGADGFDPSQEQLTFDGRRADAEETMARDDVRAYGRASDSAIVVIEPILGMPAATACDLFLPSGASTAGFMEAVADIAPRSAARAWSEWHYNDGQAPRPGPWAINLAVIDPTAAELTTFLGVTPDFAILSRNSFRGPLPE